MQHTKKLVLMEPKFVKPTIKDNALSKLDTELSEILNSKLNDDLKMKLYSSVFRKYKAYDHEPTSYVNPLDTLEENVIKSTPQNLQYKAKRILTQLGKDSDVNFTQDGKLVYKQVPIEESNILDLVSDVMSKHPGFAKGGQEIASSLQTTKTPKELVANPIITKLMKKEKKEEKKEELKPKRGRKTKKVSDWEPY